MKFFSAFALLLIFFATANAQEFNTPLKYNAQLNEASKKVTHPKYRSADTLTLPFFDDFSKPETFPDPSLWINKGVYVNTTMPVNPISIGVATFDGLSQSGKPYDTTGSTNAGPADTLISLPFHFENYKPGDSIYLSFFYEAQGYGDQPNLGDSIILQFKTLVPDSNLVRDSAVWVNVWAHDGPDTITPFQNQYFRQVMIPITDAAYLYRGFQFMFHNIATLSGANDDWHIDYIRLDTLRTIADTTVNDAAIAYIPTSILKNYYEMPWSQFQNFQSSELGVSNEMHIRNNFNSTKNTPYSYVAKESYTGTQLSAPPIAAINAPAMSNDSVSFPTFNINASPPFDSASVSIKYSINVTSDIIPQNDTVVKTQNFFDYYAYDDGSAEAAYSLSGIESKLAVQFHTNVPDTLRAIQISYGSVLDQINELLMTLFVWKSITPTEVVEYNPQVFVFPAYVDSVNGFYTYVLDSPQAINGDFYIGYQQVNADFIYVGQDKNTDSHQNVYYNTDGYWQQSDIPGSLMIRAVIGKRLPYQYYATGIKHVSNPLSLAVYPNPAENQLNLKLSTNQKASYSIIDCTGRTVKYSNVLTPSIDISSLSDGLYLLKVNEPSGNSYFSKFIKQQ